MLVTMDGQQLNSTNNGLNVTLTNGQNGNGTFVLNSTGSFGQMDCYEDMFKEITKKLYGEEGIPEMTVDGGATIPVSGNQSIIYDPNDFRTDASGTGGMAGHLAAAALQQPSAVTLVTPNGLAPGTIVLQRRIQDEKGRIWTIEGIPQLTSDQVTLATLPASMIQSSPSPVQQHSSQPQVEDHVTLQHEHSHHQHQQVHHSQHHQQQQEQQQQEQQQQLLVQQIEDEVPEPPSYGDERWFESEDTLHWTESRIARYNPSHKVFRCVDCDFIGFLSRVAEHWLGNHASLRVFQCPRCPYTNAWAKSMRTHISRQHSETLTDKSLFKENPVLEEITKFLVSLKNKVESKQEILGLNLQGKRYNCAYCEYSTDRRDLFNRHENIHRDEKPFQCYVCEKQFNRADHVKKHFMRMHKDHAYDINKIKKPRAQAGGTVPYFSKTHQKQIVKQSDIKSGTKKSLVPTNSNNSSGSNNNISTGDSALGFSTGADVLKSPNGGSVENVAILNNIMYCTSVSSSALTPTSTTKSSTLPLNTSSAAALPDMGEIGGTKKPPSNKGKKSKKPGEKMFSCSYCPWQGVDNWCLKRHLNTHIKPFLCNLCDYKAARSERLATHVLKVHNKRVCHKCSFLADDTEGLSIHIQESHQNPLVKTGFNCNVCNEYFEMRADLEAHAILEHQKVIVQCDLCDFRTTDELSMETHLREKHNLQPGMGAVAAAAAAAAAAAVGSQSELLQQQSQPSEGHSLNQNDVLNDMICGKDKDFSSGLLGADHEGSLVVPSDFTNQTEDILDDNKLISMSLDDVVQSSMISGSSISLESTGDHILNDEKRESEVMTICEICGIDFAYESSLKAHQKIHLASRKNSKLSFQGGTDVVESKGETPGSIRNVNRDYLCSLCSYTSYTQKMMIHHLRSHNGFELVCKADGCDFTTPFENSLKEHILGDHSNEPVIRCPHCGLRMSSVYIFTIHWRFHHSNLCSLCVNVYKNKCDLKEDQIHEWTLKTPLQLLTGEHERQSHLLVSSTISTSCGIPSPTLSHMSAVSSNCPSKVSDSTPTTPVLASNPQSSAVAKPKSNLPSIIKRESVKILPCMSEIIVTRIVPRKKKPQPRNTLEIIESRLKRKKRKRKQIMRDLHALVLKRKVSGVHVPKCIRHSQKGTLNRLFRNGSSGFKCYHASCIHRNWKFPSKIGLIKHKHWRHRSGSVTRIVNCDECDFTFAHMYQAFIHKFASHPQLKSSKNDATTLGARANGRLSLGSTLTNSNGTNMCLQQQIFQFSQHPVIV